MYIYIIGHIWYICNWLRSSIVQAGCMFACNCTPTVVTRIYWVRVKECHYLVSFHSVLPSLECTLPALNRNNCFPSDDFLDSNDCLIRGWWLECLQFHLVCQGMRVFVIFLNDFWIRNLICMFNSLRNWNASSRMCFWNLFLALMHHVSQRSFWEDLDYLDSLKADMEMFVLWWTAPGVISWSAWCKTVTAAAGTKKKMTPQLWLLAKRENLVCKW